MSNSSKQKRKMKKWPWILGGLIIIIIAAVVFLPSLMPNLPTFNIESVAVTRGNIAETVVSTGTLESDSGEEIEIEIPVGVRVDKIYVELDDVVAVGDMLATIEPLSLQHRIASIQDEIVALDTSINRNNDDDDEEVIRTGVDGRVKRIYADTGDVAVDVMSEYGVLMLISIDGKMAVDIDSTAELSIGDSVTVVQENGTRRTGNVALVINGGYTITLTDNGPELDENVEIQDRDRNVLGSGSLYINQPISVVASSGTVKTIHVSENQRIWRNNRLLTLENVPLNAEYRQMLIDRVQLVNNLNELLRLSETHTILADTDGTVMNISITEESITSSNTNSADAMNSNSTQSDSSNDGFLTVAFIIEQEADVIFAIEVDELDILSIQVGQEVNIVFNALPDQHCILRHRRASETMKLFH